MVSLKSVFFRNSKKGRKGEKEGKEGKKEKRVEGGKEESLLHIRPVSRTASPLDPSPLDPSPPRDLPLPHRGRVRGGGG